MDQEIKTQLEQLPTKIQEKQKYQYDATVHIEEKELIIKNSEINVLMQITDEIDTETGKAKYSNDTKRKVELNSRLESNKEYNDAKVDLESLKKAKALSGIELDFLKNTFKALLVIAGDTQ